METNDTNSKFLPAAVVVAGLLIAGAVFWNGSRPADPAGSPQGGAPVVDVNDIDIAGNPFIGDANAPVTVIEWADFQCPFCKQFEVNTMPQIIRDYVDTGKAKIVFMDFAFLGPDSIDAGLYSRAIWKLYPDRYLKWREAMYQAQDEEHGGFGDAASIDKLNATINGIDAAKVAADVKTNGGAYQAQMDADRAEAQKLGINATPSFVVGNQVIAGAYPYPTFQTAIEDVLK